MNLYQLSIMTYFFLLKNNKSYIISTL